MFSINFYNEVTIFCFSTGVRILLIDSILGLSHVNLKVFHISSLASCRLGPVSMISPDISFYLSWNSLFIFLSLLIIISIIIIWSSLSSSVTYYTSLSFSSSLLVRQEIIKEKYYYYFPV